MIKEPFFSIIIPVRNETDYLRETLQAIQKQTYKKYEVLVITDKISGKADPSYKRNLGAKMAKGKYLAFLDDDSFPDINWLKNTYKQIQVHQDYAAFCGPCLTPPADNTYQQASGLVWSSWLGSGGAGVYRNSISSQIFVDDYPTVNLIVKKSDFNSIDGFQSKYWPGEDTILCLDLTKKLQKKIFYHPSIIVFHHRRSVIVPHLQQITRYALHRGHFAKIFPSTSFRIGYLMPSMFLIYLIMLLIITVSGNLQNIFLLPLYTYFSLQYLTFILLIMDKKPILTSLLAIVCIPITHLYYGLLFIIGFLKPELKFKPHVVDQKTGNYLGG